jgi:hypothetical protein
MGYSGGVFIYRYDVKLKQREEWHAGHYLANLSDRGDWELNLKEDDQLLKVGEVFWMIDGVLEDRANGPYRVDRHEGNLAILVYDHSLR